MQAMTTIGQITCDTEMNAQFEGAQKEKSRRSYVQISLDQRRQLLEMITHGHLTIKEAADKLGLKYSAAKNIAKIFKEEGRIEKLSKKRPIINVQVNCGVSLLNFFLVPQENGVYTLQFYAPGTRKFKTVAVTAEQLVYQAYRLI